MQITRPIVYKSKLCAFRMAENLSCQSILALPCYKRELWLLGKGLVAQIRNLVSY